MVFNATFNNISVTFLRSVLLVEETRVSGDQRFPGACNRWIKAAFNSNATALWRPSWRDSATAGHNFGRGPLTIPSKFGSN